MHDWQQCQAPFKDIQFARPLQEELPVARTVPPRNLSRPYWGGGSRVSARGARDKVLRAVGELRNRLLWSRCDRLRWFPPPPPIVGGQLAEKDYRYLTIGMCHQTHVTLSALAPPNARKERHQTHVDNSFHPTSLPKDTSRAATGGGLFRSSSPASSASTFAAQYWVRTTATTLRKSARKARSRVYPCPNCS